MSAARRTWHRALLGVLAPAIPVGNGYSAEFDLSSQNTYLSPKVLESAFPLSGNSAARASFFNTSITSTFEQYYQYHDEFAHTSSLTGRILSDYYVRDYQFEASYSRRRPIEAGDDIASPIVPLASYTVAAAYYWSVPLVSPTTARSRPTAGDLRIMGGWKGDRRRDGSFTGEIFVDLSARISSYSLIERSTFLKDVDGGYLYVWRTKTREGLIGYAFHAIVCQWGPEANLRIGTSILGTARDQRWTGAAFQNQVLFSAGGAIPRTTIELGFSCTRDLAKGRWRPQAIFSVRNDAWSKLVRK